MPNTRRSTGGPRTRAALAKGQSTLSFSNKVTKNVPSHIKKNIDGSHAVAKVESPSAQPAAEDHVDEIEEPKASIGDIEVADVEVEDSSESEVEEEVAPEKSEAEIKAEKISDAQVSKYWKELEKERLAPRVHQEGLSISEKVLRYFDVSSQYGPCVGVTRLSRWKRADRLGLHPPPEVLAVLLKEEQKATKGIQVAHIDEILNSTAIGS